MNFSLRNPTNIMIWWVRGLQLNIVLNEGLTKRSNRWKPSVQTCSMKRRVILSNIWLPFRAVTAMYKNSPSSTAIGIFTRNGRTNSERPIRICEQIPVSRVSRTRTILEQGSRYRWLIWSTPCVICGLTFRRRDLGQHVPQRQQGFSSAAESEALERRNMSSPLKSRKWCFPFYKSLSS